MIPPFDRRLAHPAMLTAAPALILCVALLTVCGAARARATCAGQPGGPHAGLFADQGSMYDSNPEPTASESVTLTLRACKSAITSARIEYAEAGRHTFRSIPMHPWRTDPTGRFEYWRGTVPASGSAKRYRFEVRAGTANLWFNAAGISATAPSAGDFFILPGFETPDWMKNGVMYQIFVDRFYDGDPGNDVRSGQYTYEGCATERHSWTSGYTHDAANVRGCNGEVFFGGDLAGIDEKLGYIKRTLGADILYLTPIFQSPTNHKYDTQNYYKVDPAFGTHKTLGRLIADVHSSTNGPRGYIILDGVFNHTGDSNCWFGRATYDSIACPRPGAYQSRSSPYYRYYTFRSWPKRYAMFFDVKTMPKLNYGTSGSPVREQIFGRRDSVVQTYLRAPYRVDGWRLDSAQLIDSDGRDGSDFTNHEIMRELRRAVKSVNPDAEILGEYWGDAAPWLDAGTEWDSAMNYNGFTEPVSEWICGEKLHGKPASIDATQLDAWLHRTRADLPVNAQEAMTNELGTHDTMRFATRCGGNIRKTWLGLILQFTYIGTPGIYYGDEYGMHGGNDPENRHTFDWSKATSRDPTVALARRLIAIRKRYAALRTGSFMTLLTDDAHHVYVFGRFDARHRIAVVLNDSSKAQTVTVPAWELSMRNASRVTDLLTRRTYRVNHGTLAARVHGYYGAILEQ